MKQLPKYEITVTLLNRTFPLLVQQKEEKVLTRAVKLIKDKISEYQKRYNGPDDLSLALMCCIELASDQLRENQGGSDMMEGTVDSCHRLLDESLRMLASETTLSSSSERKKSDV